MKPLILKMRLCLLFLLSVPIVFAPRILAQKPPSSGSSAPTSAQSDLSKRQEAFQIVWNTVNDLFYDPTFGGVNWVKVRERYEPLVAKANNDQEFHQLLQQMLNELHQSHFIVIPREAIPKVRLPEQPGEASDSGDDDIEEDQPLDTINYKLTDRLLTGIGIDLRVLNGSAVVTRVAPGSTAAKAGLRPGFVIKKVGDRSLDWVIAEIERHPLWSSIIRPELPIFLIAGFINGDELLPVRIGYLDGKSRLRTISVRRERLKGDMSPAIGNLPAMYTEFESKRLQGGIGYIRFNAFVPPLMEKLCRALRSMKNAPGIILDLRGNQGGLLGMIGGLSGLIEANPISFGALETRGGQTPLFVFPQTAPYSGPLVVLLDGSTQSAGELFSSGLQEAGRAALVGDQSAGNTLPSAIKKLPTGALFQYGFANYRTQSGKHLEGRGVSPDVRVMLTRKALLRGGDPQLRAAIRKVRDQIQIDNRSRDPGKPPTIVTDVAASAQVVSVAPDKPAPPPARPLLPPAEPAKALSAAPAGLPSVDSILEKYLEATGGKSVLEKLTSRLSKGTVEITALGARGSFELYEEAPNKWSLIINAPGLGVMQRTFDGSRGWLQDPLQGYIRFTGPSLDIARIGAVFNKQTRLRELYPRLTLIGKEKVKDKDAYAVLMGFEKWLFDVDSGLLLRRGFTSYDDYREVDGVKLPFNIREDFFSGVGLTYEVKEVKHNISIDKTKFTEYPSCFTKP